MITTEAAIRRADARRTELIDLRTRGFNQRAETVITFERTILVYGRDHRPNA